jgi:dTDP-4-dehydrorhamnose reductase
VSPRILVLGSTGRLGGQVVKRLSIDGHQVLAHGFSLAAKFKCDVTSREDFLEFLNNLKPDVVINLVALTDVDLCERATDNSFALNVRPSEILQEYSNSISNKIRLLHVSTDHMYNYPGPSTEEQTHPVNVYAKHKLLAERFYSEKRDLVLRTNFFGKVVNNSKQSYTDWIVAGLSNNKTRAIYDNVYFSPIGIQSLATEISKQAITELSGIYNLGSSTALSKYDFACRFAEGIEADKSLVIPTKYDPSVSNSVERPLDMTMSVEKYQLATGLMLGTLEEEIGKEVIKYAK